MAKNTIKHLQKCKRLAKNHKKKDQKSQLNTLDMPQWIPLLNATQRSIPNDCYVAKNGPERTKKGQKRTKMAKKGDFVYQNSPLSHKNFTFSPIKIWSELWLKIAPKLRVLGSKCIKPTLKSTDWGPIMEVFKKYEKWCTLKPKISETKVWK